MTNLVEVNIPDIGDFVDVDVIEVLIAPGDRVNVEDPLVTLESDKATMDVPSPHTGVIQEVLVRVGDKVSEGTPIVTVHSDDEQTTDATDRPPEPSAPKSNESAVEGKQGELHADIVVLGSGPGGYTAAFRAADLGKSTILVERYPTLGGVCLNVGCIPSKALLHAARVISETKEMSQHGISFGTPTIDVDKLGGWKSKVVSQLTDGLAGLAKRRKVKVVQGIGQFVSPNRMEISTDNDTVTVSFDQAIIAAGSEAATIPGIPYGDPRIFDSTGALELAEIPQRLLVIGGGIIGLEMATVYHQLGSNITVVEMLDSLIAGADKDVVKPLHQRIQGQYENIFLSTKVSGIEPSDDGLRVHFDGADAPATETFEQVLVAVGRRPNGSSIGADNAGINVDQRGFIAVDKQQRTNVPHIFAIGDIVGEPMLAHKATHEGKVAAEVASELKSAFDARVIPSVAYTDPEVAWAGPTEAELKAEATKYGKGVFPWVASGRALGLGRSEGMTKLLFEPDSHRIIAAGIVGTNAGDLIAEVALAIEMGCDAQDLSLTIHPHPTLSETVCFAAEAFEGTITDLYMPKKR
ncbi:MAG: dihydrolipoyl dehydrogenase [Gammaproteobacteria bacterium]|nr:dihydrolipoyl dehydrogenase [Gammaproteobacteria bacterium]